MTTKLETKGKPGLFPSMGMAGLTALIVVNFTHPIEVVKTRLQVEGTFSAKTKCIIIEKI